MPTGQSDYEARIFPQFVDLLEILQEHVGKRSLARRNTGQGDWLGISDSYDTRLELLAGLDRVALNEEFKQIAEKGEDILALVPEVL